MSCNSTSTFYITSSLEELFDSGSSFFAVAESNFLGTVYNVYSPESGSEK